MASNVKNCVLYARLSVTKEESVSIERQLRAGRKYAEGRGWAVIGEFVDDGVSATANRPEDRKGWAAFLDPYLEERLLTERGNVPLSGRTVRDHWQRAWGSDDEKRAVFCSQLESLHIRRGVAGRRFDADRVLIQWRTPGEVA